MECPLIAGTTPTNGRLVWKPESDDEGEPSAEVLLLVEVPGPAPGVEGDVEAPSGEPKPEDMDEPKPMPPPAALPATVGAEAPELELPEMAYMPPEA